MWLLAASPAVLLGLGAVFTNVELWQRNRERDVYGALGTYALLSSGALVLVTVWVAIAWDGIAAKIAALFAFLTALPLGLWGLAWVLRVLEFLPDVQRLDDYRLLRLGVSLVAPTTGAITFVFGAMALWQRRTSEPGPNVRGARK